MKKIFLLIILILFSCKISEYFEPTQIRYRAVGNLMDISITTYNDYYKDFVTLNFNNWIGEFNYTTEFQKAGDAYISVTNLNGNEIIAAIYKNGSILSFNTDINFVELQESIE